MCCIHFHNAGYGGLSLSIEGPSKAEIQCKDNEDGTLNISYKPTEPGYYIVNLKFADHHVDGSPFTVKVGAFMSVSECVRACMLDSINVLYFKLILFGTDTCQTICTWRQRYGRRIL